MRQVLRNEKKYLIGIEEQMAKCAMLSQVLHPDPHNGPRGYLVRSLYFDTIDDGDLFDKSFGVEIRRKMRLRVYDPAGSFALLEMKQKQGAQQRKRSLRLEREEAERIAVGEYTPLLRHRDPFAAECYALLQTRCYRPKTIVQYRRIAFVARENATRITFDHEIDATESRLALFDPALNLTPVMSRCKGVLEVKYNGFLLSYIKDLLADLSKSELSVSKYAMARQLNYQEHL